MRRIVLSLAFLVGLTPPAGHAGDDTSQPMDSYFLETLPVVLSASRLAQPVSESPAAMTVIDRDLIEASGAITLPDVLRLVPGFQVSLISGANLTAQYHGLANQHPKRMQVLIDGRSVYHSAFGGVHWDTLPITLDDVDRIEVLRGSNASAYGSNAFMGVVNIITRHPAHDRGHHVSLLDGYQGTRMAGWRFGDHIGRLDYRISLSEFKTDGFPNYRGTHTWWDSTGGPVPPISVTTGTRLKPKHTLYTLARQDSQTILRMNLRGDYRMENGDNLLLELGYAHNDRENTLADGNYELMRPNEKLRAGSQLIKWSHEAAEGSMTSLQFSHNRLDFDTRHTAIAIQRNAGILINAGPVLGGQRFHNDRYDLELEHHFDLGGWRTALGAGLRLDSLNGENFAVDNRDLQRQQYRVFGNTEKHFGKQDQWVVNAGLMLEHQQRLGSFASPRLSLSLHLNDYNTLRLATSRAYRMPSLYEQFGASRVDLLDPSSIDPALTKPLTYQIYSDRGTRIRPERLDSIELGLVSADWIDGLSFDARLFYERLDKYIDEVLHRGVCNGCDSVSTTVPGFANHDLWAHENAGWLKIKGIELQARHHISDRTLLNLSSSLTRTKGRRIKKRNADGSINTTMRINDYVPHITLSGLISHRFDHDWTGSLAYYYMGMMNWPNDGDRLHPYDRVDLRLAKHFRLHGNKAQVELIAQNLGNQSYQEFRYDNKFERRVYLRLRIDAE